MMGPPPTRITPFPTRPRQPATTLALPPLSQPIQSRPNQHHPEPESRYRLPPPPPRNRTNTFSSSASQYGNPHQQAIIPSSQPQSYPYDHSFSPSPGSSRQPTPARGIVDTYRPGTPASNGPRSAAEIYTQSVEPKVSMGDKIISAISGLGGRLDTMQDSLDSVRDAQKNIRDQVHELQTCQRSLVTREEIIEEITNQLSPALHEFFQNLHDKLDTALEPLPSQTADRSAEKIKAILLDLRTIDQKSQESQSQSKESLGALIKHLTTSLTPVQNLTDLLDSLKELPQAVRDVAIFKTSLEDIRQKIDKPSSPPGWDDLKQSMESIQAGVPSGRGVERENDILQELRALKQGLEDIKGRNEGSAGIANLVEMLSATRNEIEGIRQQLTRQGPGISDDEPPKVLLAQAQRQRNLMGEEENRRLVTRIRRDPPARQVIPVIAPPILDRDQPFMEVDAFGPVIPIDQVPTATISSELARPATAPLLVDADPELPQLGTEEDADTTTATSSSSSEASNRSGSWKPDSSKSKKPTKRKAPARTVAPIISNPLKSTSFTQTQLLTQTQPSNTTTRSVTTNPISQDRSTSARVSKKPKLTQTNLQDAFTVTSGYDLGLGIMTRARSVSVKKVLSGERGIVSNVNDPIVIGSSSEESVTRVAQTGDFVPGIDAVVKAKNKGGRPPKGKGKEVQIQETPTPISKDVKADLMLSLPVYDSLNSVNSLNSQDLEAVLSSSNTTNPEVDETEDYLLETQYPVNNDNYNTQSLAPDPDSIVEGQQQQQFTPRLYPAANTQAGKGGNGRFQRLASPESPDLGIGTGGGGGLAGRRLTTYGSGSGRGLGGKVAFGGKQGGLVRVDDAKGWDSSDEE